MELLLCAASCRGGSADQRRPSSDLQGGRHGGGQVRCTSCKRRPSGGRTWGQAPRPSLPTIAPLLLGVALRIRTALLPYSTLFCFSPRRAPTACCPGPSPANCPPPRRAAAAGPAAARFSSLAPPPAAAAPASTAAAAVAAGRRGLATNSGGQLAQRVLQADAANVDPAVVEAVRGVEAGAVPAVARAAMVTGITDKAFLEALAQSATNAMPALSPGGESRSVQGAARQGGARAGAEGRAVECVVLKRKRGARLLHGHRRRSAGSRGGCEFSAHCTAPARPLPCTYVPCGSPPHCTRAPAAPADMCSVAEDLAELGCFNVAFKDALADHILEK